MWCSLGPLSSIFDLRAAASRSARGNANDKVRLRAITAARSTTPSWSHFPARAGGGLTGSAPRRLACALQMARSTIRPYPRREAAVLFLMERGHHR